MGNDQCTLVKSHEPFLTMAHGSHSQRRGLIENGHISQRAMQLALNKHIDMHIRELTKWER